MVYFYIIATIFFTVYGQLILKWRINLHGELPYGMFNKISYLFTLFLDPFIVSAFTSAFIASFFWMATMTKLDVSVAYPYITAGLTVVTVTLAIIILNEHLDIFKVAGILLIVTGVLVLSYST